MILVTGASGLLGSHLTKELTAHGKKVRALYRRVVPEQIDGVEWVRGDILDTPSLENALADIEEVYHCAALVSFQPGKEKELYNININGTANIVNGCLESGVKKLLFVSSVAALGRAAEEDNKINEKMNWTEKTGKSDYGKSKYLAEMEVWRGIGEGLQAVIINPATILGAGDWEKGSSEIFRAAYNEVPWYTRGTNGFVDVLDVVKAMQLLMNGTPSNERFIISAVNVSFREIFTEIALCFGKKPPYKEVTPLLAGLLWRWESIKTKLTHKEAILTKDSVRTAMSKVYYDNSKLKFYAPNFEYKPIKESIKRICDEFIRKYHL